VRVPNMSAVGAAAAAIRKPRPPRMPHKVAEKPLELIKKWKIVRGDTVGWNYV